MVKGFLAPVAGGAERLHALDGLRGLMALFVLVAHYFGEVGHGLRGLAVGWIAVIMFFVLSGFVVGRQLLVAPGAGFLKGFLIRRTCRTVPAYVASVLLAAGLLALAADAPWLEGRNNLPLLSYLSFTQNFAMVALADPGARWLVPTWTLTVEQQFYLLAPALVLLAPRRHLFVALLLGAGASVLYRWAALAGGLLSPMAALVLLPASTDALLLGVAAALAVKDDRLSGDRWLLALRIAAPAMLVAAALLRLAGETPFAVLGPTLVAVGCAAFLLAVVRGAPEAGRLHARSLRFIGRISYCLYLTHLTVLGVLHGLILGARPDVGTLPQLAVTALAVVLAILGGWLMTVFLEQPITGLGRRWAGAGAGTRHGAPAVTAPAVALG